MRERLNGFGTKAVLMCAAGLALAGSAYAGARVDGADLVPGSITGRQVAASAIGFQKLKPVVRQAIDARGATGPQGSEGPHGPAGPAGSTALNVPADADIYVTTDGGLQNVGAGATDFAVVDVGIFVDGVVFTTAGQRRVSAVNNSGLNQNIANWSFGRAFSLSPGSHTFEVRAAHVAGSTANVSSSAAPQLQGALTVSVVRH